VRCSSSYPSPYFVSAPTWNSPPGSHSRDQLLRDPLTLGPRDIQRDRALVAVHTDEIRTLLRTRHVGRGEAARVVTGAGALDLDHVGAEIGQHLRAGRSGQHARQVEHAQSTQRSRGKWSGGLRANGFAHAFLPLALTQSGGHIGPPLIPREETPAMPDTGLTPQRAVSIESRASWVAACATLSILSISYGRRCWSWSA
jgi:hypothetical protein